MEEETMRDRRVFERVEPADDCIVVHSSLIGNIKNISSDGLFCSCFQESACENSDHKEIDILCGQGNFLVKGLKVRIINMETISGKFLKDFEIKKCRMQFKSLHEEQTEGIQSILSGACVH